MILTIKIYIIYFKFSYYFIIDCCVTILQHVKYQKLYKIKISIHVYIDKKEGL